MSKIDFYNYTVFPKWLKDELSFREAAYDYKQNDPLIDDQENPKNWMQPRTVWMRFVSNAIDEKNGIGFIMDGGQSFSDSYGFKKDIDGYVDDNSIIGKKINGENHVLTNSVWVHRPPPGVISITVENNGSGNQGSTGGFLTEARIRWRCWSPDQLDYLAPYFLTPGITALIQWGWDNCPIPPISIDGDSNGDLQLKITSTEGLDKKELNDFALGDFWNGESALYAYNKMHEKSAGRMGMVFGFITNFEISINDLGGFDCETTISTTGFLAEYLSIKDKTETDEKGNPKITQKEWFDTFFNTLTDHTWGDWLGSMPWTVSSNRSDNTEINNENPIEGLSQEPIVNSNGMIVDISPYLKSKYWKKQIFSFKRFFENTPNDQKLEIEDYEAIAENKFYLRFNIIVDLINAFYSDQIKKGEKSLKVFYLSITEKTQSGKKYRKISANPNLKPINDNIFIPNARAPIGFCYNWNKGNGVVDSFKADADSTFDEADKILFDYSVGSDIVDGKYAKRVDLFHNILLRGLSKDVMNDNPFIEPLTTFPAYYDDADATRYGYFGYLKDIYVNSELVKKAFTEQETLSNAVTYLLDSMNEASSHTWSLKMVPMTGEFGNGDMTIIDTNYIGDILIDDFKNKKNEDLIPYEFKYGTHKSIVKNLTIRVNAGSEVALQTIAKSYEEDFDESQQKNQSKMLNGRRDKSINFKRKDRMFGVFNTMSKIKKSSDKDVPANNAPAYVNPQASKAEKSEDMVFKIKDGNGYYLVRAVESDSTLQSNILSDDNPANNAKFNMPITNIEATLTILGVTGFKPRDLVDVMGIPKILKDKGVFGINSYRHEINEGNWVTILDLLYTPAPKPKKK